MEPTCWATPLVVPLGDSFQVIMNGQTKARAYDLETGQRAMELRWADGAAGRIRRLLAGNHGDRQRFPRFFCGGL